LTFSQAMTVGCIRTSRVGRGIRAWDSAARLAHDRPARRLARCYPAVPPLHRARLARGFV